MTVHTKRGNYFGFNQSINQKQKIQVYLFFILDVHIYIWVSKVLAHCFLCHIFTKRCITVAIFDAAHGKSYRSALLYMGRVPNIHIICQTVIKIMCLQHFIFNPINKFKRGMISLSTEQFRNKKYWSAYIWQYLTQPALKLINTSTYGQDIVYLSRKLLTYRQTDGQEQINISLNFFEIGA